MNCVSMLRWRRILLIGIDNPAAGWRHDGFVAKWETGFDRA